MNALQHIRTCKIKSLVVVSAAVIFFMVFEVWSFINPTSKLLGKYVTQMEEIQLTVKPLDEMELSPLVERQHVNSCANVLSSMVKGKWVTRKLTPAEETEIDQFLLTARRGHNLPSTLERPDKKCGNVTFDFLKGRFNPLLWFRALCNPKGDKPCCQGGRCIAAKQEECVCQECYDVRQQVHAEYSQWVTTDSDCQPKQLGQTEICKLLEQGFIVFVGDSFVRHIYTALLLLVKNDFQYGALKPTTPESVRMQCRGMYMFTEKVCRMWLNRDVFACNNTVRIIMNEQVASKYGAQLPLYVHNLANRPRSIVILGIGIHNDYNANLIISQFLQPLMNLLQFTKPKWPKLLWAAPHAPGLLKTPRIPEQTYESVRAFNQIVDWYLASYNVPVFDTFNLTDGCVSFDGAHYGIGINILKAGIILDYITELSRKGEW